MRVSLPYGTRSLRCSDNVVSVIIDALLKANQDGQDIVTLSLGGADGWTASASAVVASRIAKGGKIVTIAAGNDVCLLSSSLLVHCS